MSLIQSPGFLMREKFTRNAFLIVQPSYIRATMARLRHRHSLPSTPLACARACPLRFSPLSSLRRYLLETRKRPIRLTYVLARLLLQRSLRSQFWHSYSRVRPFMTVSGWDGYTMEGRAGKTDRIQDIEEDRRAVRPPLRLPFEGTSERISVVYPLYRHGRLRNVSFAATWKISLVLADLGFMTPSRFLRRERHGRWFKV